jgi:hypothetical protein
MKSLVAKSDRAAAALQFQHESDRAGEPFDPALQDLRMNRAAARFTSLS